MKHKPGDPKLAVAYVTASTREGLDEQRQMLAAVAERRGIEVIAWHGDTTPINAPIESREGIVSAIAGLRRAGAGVLLVSSYAHLSTDSLVVSAIAGIVQLRGATIVAASLKGAQTQIEDTRVSVAISVVMSLMERERGVGLRITKAGLRRQGKVASGLVPYGWRVGKDGTLLREESEAKVIKFVIGQWRKGRTFSEIARLCTKKGYLSRKRTAFYGSQISQMVKNQTSKVDRAEQNHYVNSRKKARNPVVFAPATSAA